MLHPFRSLPQPDHYWLTNAHVPLALLQPPDASLTTAATRDGLVAVQIEIRSGQIAQICSHQTEIPAAVPAIDMQRGLVFPCFVDMHTHLDKGHAWERSPNLDGTFNTALSTVKADSAKGWSAEDVFRRMEFGLKCSYAHGTRALRTHLDAFGKQAEISLEVFKVLQEDWRDRLTLQVASLVTLDQFQTPAGEKLADLIAETGGVLGGLPLMEPALDERLDRIFALASDRQLDLDFHTDESGNPDDITLRHVAAAALRHNFQGQIVCGHCCSLSVQSPEEIQKTFDLVKQSKIGIVSLPMCNLYLQDRSPFHPPIHPSTPRWRGVTLLHELKQAGIPVAVASDNCRDPFYGFGDHDMLEVLTQATRIAHLDTPYGDWCRVVTTTPAELMGLPQLGRLGTGSAADLILFKARYYSELLSRPQTDRIVLRNGNPIDTTLPDYSELDDLLQFS